MRLSYRRDGWRLFGRVERYLKRLRHPVMLGLLATAPVVAEAHVKWFVSYDLFCPPRQPFSVLLSHYFLAISALVAPLMFAVSYADRMLACSLADRAVALRLNAALDAVTAYIGSYTPTIIRYTAAAFFFCAFLYGDFILTPELKTNCTWVRWLQLATALLALPARTAWLAALGAVVLFGQGIVEYGVFHMLDYPIFIGVAICLFIWSRFGERYNLLADAVLRSFSSVTLLWGAIEKFAYPEWSFVLLAQRPGLTLGINPELYMVAAGFVEFCAAYLLITGKFASRAAAIVLLFFFLSAIGPFGLIDLVGHSVIIAVLVALAFGSANSVAPRFDVRSPRVTALAHTGIFFAVLVMLMGSYYGIHYLSYRT